MELYPWGICETLVMISSLRTRLRVNVTARRVARAARHFDYENTSCERAQDGTCAPRHCFPRKNSGLPTTHATPKMIQEETVARKRKVTRPTHSAAPCKTYRERRAAKRQQSSPTKSEKQLD